MNAYLDTSVFLSRLLKQRNQLKPWGQWDAGYTSMLTRLEFMRTVDRMRLMGALLDQERVELQERFDGVWDALHRVRLSQQVLDRACAALPTVLGTLDALHLVTAQQVIETRHIELVFLTHDEQLATAARAVGMPVVGVAA